MLKTLHRQSFLVILLLSTITCASLTTVGTATYLNNDFKLIYDSAQQLTWLDYSSSGRTYSKSKDWAQSLNTELTINLDPAYIAHWDNTSWRLAGNADGYFGYYSANRHVYSSEMGNLYYDALGNELDDTSLNFGDFDNILTSYHISADSNLEAMIGRSFSPVFDFTNGRHSFGSSSVNGGRYAMAVRPGIVPEPISISIWGVASLVFLSRKRVENRSL